MIVQASNGTAIDTQQVIWLAVWLLAAELATTLLHNIGGYLGDVMAEKMRRQLSVGYYTHLLALPQHYYDRELTGTIINRLNRTISELTNFINAFANNFSSMLLTVVLVVIIVFRYSWELGVMLLVLYPLFMWLTALTSKKWMRWMKRRNEQIDIASGRFAEVVAQIKVVKSFVHEQRELSGFDNRFKKDVALTKEQSRYWHGMDVLRRLVLNIIVFCMYAFIFVGTLNRRFSIGDMVLLIQYINLARQPIFGMSFMIDQSQKAIAGSKDYFDVMSEQPEQSDDNKKLLVTNAKIEYKQVQFGYDTENPVLNGISFTVEPGQKVAFVGESGEGKTTLASILLKLYPVQKGSIEIDGHNIACVSQSSLRKSIAMVFQEPALFSGTIKENISYANPGASDKQIIQAAKDANAYDFIMKFDKGFDSEIGERGLKLSGGQKQRIAIARAMVKNAPILILDEATSSLDSKSEHLVQQALDRLMKQRTTLIIAHRLSTIAHVDKIITLKNGRIDEQGAPGELATTGGIYAQLLALQMETGERAKKSLQKFGIAL